MILLIDKPTGHTSFSVIKKLKKLYPQEKIGHAGTLDPLATGLLVVAIGNDTKQLRTFVGLDKTYLATIDFSKKSDTWDSDYWEYYEELAVPTRLPTEKNIATHLTSIIGTHPLPLTPFSAKKRKGKKLYQYARAGKPVCIDMPMEVVSYQIVSYAFPELNVRIRVGSGTYIRSIAHRLGQQLGVGGIITRLHRESVGGLCLEKSY